MLEPLAMPAWASLDQILISAQSISQPSFWEEMLQAADPAEAATLMGMMHVPAQNDLALRISDNNGRFFSTAVAFMFLVAAAGANADSLLSPIGLHATSKKSLDAASQIFHSPAVTPNDFIDRLLILFPESNSNIAPDSAFRLLLDNGAFERVSFVRGRNVCPIIKPTQLIFEGFGKMLRTPQYQASLKQVVTK